MNKQPCSGLKLYSEAVTTGSLFFKSNYLQSNFHSVLRDFKDNVSSFQWEVYFERHSNLKLKPITKLHRQQVHTFLMKNGAKLTSTSPSV